ncbi:MAG TPA: TolC family protein, partial [Tepidisphaeraceae bacterium]|nr:TolC family protein [Tepidisphaeraceae bacterium]
EDSYKLEASRYSQRLISMQEVSQVETSLEQRRATLIRAKADARNDSDQLKELMNDPNLPVADPALIVPSDQPVEQPMEFAIDDQIDSAMENRFELGEDLLKIDTATVTYGVAQNNTLPKLNFIGSVSPDVTQSNFADALSQEGKFGHFEYSLGLQLEMPIGNREALAILRRTALQREQAIEQYAADVAQVSLDVRQAAREVAANYDIVLASRRSRVAAERALYDEVQRQQNGTEPLTPEYVQLRLDLADRFAAEKEAEDDAVANYNVALEKLEFAKGTLLKYNNVVLQEENYGDQGLLR